MSGVLLRITPHHDRHSSVFRLSASIRMKDDSEFNKLPDERIAISAQVNNPDGIVTKVRIKLPSIPVVITITFQWVFGCVFALLTSRDSRIHCVMGSQTNKCFLTPELSFIFRDQPQ